MKKSEYSRKTGIEKIMEYSNDGIVLSETTQKISFENGVKKVTIYDDYEKVIK